MFIVLLVDGGLVLYRLRCRLMVVSVWAGSKRTCPPSDLAEGNGTKSNCISSKGIHNFAYPRTGKYPCSLSSSLSLFPRYGSIPVVLFPPPPLQRTNNQLIQIP